MGISKKHSKRTLLLIKFFSGAILYFLMRITYLEHDERFFHLDSNSLFYLIFTALMVFLIWELNDLCYRFYQKKFGANLFLPKNILHYQLSVLLATIVLLVVSLYILHFHISILLGCTWDKTPFELMISELYKSLFVALLFNIAYLNIVFIRYKQKADLKEEKIKKENVIFQYEGLRNQIDPHFLFNSFSVLNTLIQNDTELATNFLNKLSDLYRYVLDNKDNNLIVLEKEIECLNAYLFLMSIRHENCIHSTIDLDNSALGLKVPTMSLQMLVENAIKHNSFNEKNPLELSISQEHTDYIVITNRLNIRRTKKTSAGIGLKNIQNRYKHYTQMPVLIKKTNTEFIVKLPLLNQTLQ